MTNVWDSSNGDPIADIKQGMEMIRNDNKLYLPKDDLDVQEKAKVFIAELLSKSSILEVETTREVEYAEWNEGGDDRNHRPTGISYIKLKIVGKMTEYELWYDKHWKEKETPMFVEWFKKEYGKAGEFVPEPDEQQEYWVRRAFALMGWLEYERMSMTLST